MGEIDLNRIQFRREAFLALIITGLACCAGMSNLLFASNSLYPINADGMAHMAKIRYLAESITEGRFPSWFPYWYNGSTVTQYYPPLSYWIATPIYIVTKNAMVAFKIYCLGMFLTGGMGIWYFCRIRIGKWCGLFGSVTYCLQPYVLLSLLDQGQVAQGPIIALAPWFLASVLSYGAEPNVKKFTCNVLLCFLMILSHPNTAFMACVCILISFLLMLPLKRITMQAYVYLIFSIIFSGILSAFWSVVGATQLENPGIPYLLGESAMAFTATKEWFFVPTNFFYFAIPISLVSLLAILIYIFRALRRKTEKREGFFILFSVILTIATVIFSFGLQIPLFKYIPMAESLVPGRILIITSTSSAILCAYAAYAIKASTKGREFLARLVTSEVCLIIILTVIFTLNPYRTEYGIKSDMPFNEMISSIDSEQDNFSKGRYTFVGPYDCDETYFPLTFDYNFAEGWNMEGTLHNQAIRNHMLAIPSDNYAYFAKNLAFWNVRSFLTIEDDMEIVSQLNKKYDFKLTTKRDGIRFYSSVENSSYFLSDKRNSLIVGIGSPGMAIEYPYLIQGRSDNISDYPKEELEQYELIYLCEPRIENAKEKKRLEDTVEVLVDRGVTVVIEPTTTKGFPIFDVTTVDVMAENVPQLQKQIDCPISNAPDEIDVDGNMPYFRVLFGLDDVYYKLDQNEGRLQNDIIGAKNVGNGKVIFIGMHLSQYLKAVYARNWGVPETESGFPECTDDVKALFEDIFTNCGVNKDFWPDPFPVKKADWNYKGVDFEYSSPTTKEMTVSVTYTPRWKATLDGKLIPVGHKENLITLDLPAGDHKVKLVYGLTKYGIAGYIISLLGLLFFIIFLKFYDIILYRFRQISTKTGRFLQISRDDEQQKND